VNRSTLTLHPVVAASDDARQLWSIVALLAVLGIALVMLAVAVFRVTRPDRELLAPLEVMGRRKWRNADPVWQRRELDAVRPEGAVPLSPTRLRPVPLEGFEAGPTAPGFDDLHGDDEPGTDELFDVGVDSGLAGLSGGAAFDPDPTPPSNEVPAIVVGEARGDLSLAQLSVDWSAPAPEDLTVAADAPLLAVDGDVVDDEATDFVVADQATDTAVDDATPDPVVDDEATAIVVEGETPDAMLPDDTTGAVTVDDDDDAISDSAVDDESNDIVR
jgi:hypothetical protein